MNFILLVNKTARLKDFKEKRKSSKCKSTLKNSKDSTDYSCFANRHGNSFGYKESHTVLSKKKKNNNNNKQNCFIGQL